MITHENNTIMSLYGYDLAQYVVELVLVCLPVVRIESKLLGFIWLGMCGEKSKAIMNHVTHKRVPFVVWL
jgi:hypothetical protein